MKTLSQIDLCLNLANIDRSWLDDESTDDSKVYEFLVQGNTTNVFQMYKPAPTQMIKDFKVTSLDGLTAVNAGNRPGPMTKDKITGKSMVDHYIECIQTGKPIKMHANIDGYLESTFGNLWYQEQCMFIAMEMAGYDLGGADVRIRKPLTKKNKKLIQEIKYEFVYGVKVEKDSDGNIIGPSKEKSEYCVGAINRGYSESFALQVFNYFEVFSKYAFNLSHALCYAFLAYRTAWLSFYYPVEWAMSCLIIDAKGGDVKKLIPTFTHCKKKGIPVLPPSVNYSSSDFTIEHVDGVKGIRFGLRAVKGIGESATDAICYLVKKDGKFTSLVNFLDRVYKDNQTLREYVSNMSPDAEKFTNPLNKGHVEALILAGAFDELESNRHKLFNDHLKYKKLKPGKNKKGVPINIPKNEQAFTDMVKLNLELDKLGIFVSKHPLDKPEYAYVNLEEVPENAKIRVTGMFKNYRIAKTSAGKKYYKIFLELKDGSTLMCHFYNFAKYMDCIDILDSKKAVEGELVFTVEGSYSSAYKNATIKAIYREISKDELKREDDENKKILLDSNQSSNNAPKLGVTDVKSLEALEADYWGSF